MQAQFDELIESFITGKVGISETFISKQLAAALARNVSTLNGEGALMLAGIGAGNNHATKTEIRRDRTKWLEAGTKNEAEQEFLDLVAQFIAHLNRTCYTGLNASEFHYALYEQGAFYGRHKDQFRNDGARKFSLICYLNDNWAEQDGGQLIIHHEDRAVQSILPNSGRTVFFQSDVVEHEVAAANKPRMSVTGWLKRV